MVEKVITKMYRIGQKWKIQTKSKIQYTAEIVNVSSHELCIKTIRDETIILSRDEIARSMLIEDSTDEQRQGTD